MIGRLRGRLAEKSAEGCLVDVGGVGYEVAVSLQSLAALPALGEEVTLHVHTHVREDILALYGFADDLERQLFLLLLAVSGIGPKVAMSILGLPAGELLRAIRDDEPRRLTTVSGVGKKTAERVCLELKDKIGRLQLAGLPAASLSSAAAPVPAREKERLNTPLAGLPAILGDVASMLTHSGFKREQAEAAALALRGREAEGLDALVRAALRSLAGQQVG
jgi:Holliday junction DNA helicase RuvA